MLKEKPTGVAVGCDIFHTLARSRRVYITLVQGFAGMSKLFKVYKLNFLFHQETLFQIQDDFLGIRAFLHSLAT